MGSLDFTALQILDPPPNDDFDNARLIPRLPFDHRTNIYAATNAPDDPPGTCTRSHSIWYRMTLPHRRRVHLTGGHIGVYTGARGALTRLACNSTASEIVFVAEGGTTYSISVTNDDFDVSPWERGVSVEQGVLTSSLSWQVTPVRRSSTET